MDFSQLREQFPLLAQPNKTPQQTPVCYLDTAATSQKPNCVLQAMQQYYQYSNANVHRAAHRLANQATTDYEAVRDKVASFITANRREEIIFTHGATESINMVAHGLTQQLNAGDLILIDTAAHHANIVPWQELAQRIGAIIKPIPLTAALKIDTQAYSQLLDEKPAVVALSHVSNAVGVLNDVNSLVKQAKAAGAITLVDGAQAVAHLAVDVQEIDCDFYVFSGHKIYGPTGVGILYGRFEQLNRLSPLLTGGEMINKVSFEATQYNTLPNRLEAGTPAIAEVIGLGAAIDFINSLDRAVCQHHETELIAYLIERLNNLGGITLYGDITHKANRPIGSVAFNLAQEHHQDVAILLDQQDIAIRSGHHCAMPLMDYLNIKGCCRASIGLYSNHTDIDRLINALEQVKSILV